MSFMRWPSIENSYHEKFIKQAVEEFPELEMCTYIVTEKLHGANMQFYFVPEEPMRVGSRNRFLTRGSKFYDIWNILPEYQHVWDEMKHYCSDTGRSVRLFGELYGRGIQKGVDYGPKKRISFFGAMVDGELVPPIRLMDSWGTLPKCHVPRVILIGGLSMALSCNIDFPTMINPIEGNICEGVVIRPYHKVYRLSNGSTFMLKKKNEAFLEKTKAPKPNVPVDSEVARLHAIFETYITENRLNNVFSNWGCIEEPQQIGEYIRLVIADALDDFVKDHGAAWAIADKKQQGQITKVGGMVAKMLQSYL